MATHVIHLNHMASDMAAHLNGDAQAAEVFVHDLTNLLAVAPKEELALVRYLLVGALAQHVRDTEVVRSFGGLLVQATTIPELKEAAVSELRGLLEVSERSDIRNVY
jgi:hypothetical protein